MLYREAGQFKTSYEKDAAIFPIRQDRIAVALVAAVAFLVVPFVATPYMFTGILIPFLIFSLAAIGLNILTGYAGQLSLGTAAFMAVGAFASYNFMLRVPGMPILLAFVGGGVMAALVGILFGLPSLRIRGFYLAVATLAAQFFILWVLRFFLFERLFTTNPELAEELVGADFAEAVEGHDAVMRAERAAGISGEGDPNEPSPAPSTDT